MSRRVLLLAVGALASALLAAVLALAIGRRDTLTLALGGHALQLLQPRALILIGLLPLLAAALPFSLSDLAPLQQLLSLAARSLLAAALVLGLARPSVVARQSRVATVLLVDVSASISNRQLAAAERFVEAVRATRPPEDQLFLVTFAARPRVVALPPDGKPLSPLSGYRADIENSDLEAALQLAYTLYPAGMIRRAVLVSDGNETEGDIAAEAEAAARRQIYLDTVSFPAEQDAEVLVRALNVPSQVKIGAPFEVSAEIYSSVPQRATVTLYQDDFLNPFDARREVALESGRNLIRWKSEVKRPGLTTYKAALSGALRDHFRANNQSLASVLVKGRPRVLYVEGEPASASYLAGALRRENIDVEVRGPYGLPASARELERFDLLLLSDVPAAFVGPDRSAAVEGYVRDAGGGFVMAGGENSFGSGGYAGSRIEKLLPVRLDTDKRRDQPQLALVLAIDRSGSMTGEKIELAKDAAKGTAELLGPEDLIGVIAFDSQAQSVVRLQRAANRVRIVGDIARLQPGGGTNILPALRESYEQLDPAHAKVKHVILLTDGQASYDGITELVDEMAEHKITISAVGVGAGADKTLLTLIAERGGGRFYFTQDAQNIPKIFTKETTEVARSALVERSVRVHAVKRAELLEGVGIGEAPPLGGYVSTKPKPLSELLLVSDTGEPILARWRVGLGQSVAFTSDVKNRWASQWLKWPGYSKLWAHLVRSTMRHSLGTAGPGYELRADVDPPRVRVTVDAVGPEDQFISGLDTALEILDPDHPIDKRETVLAQTAPGRYQGTFTLNRYGSYLLRAMHRRGGVVLAESTGAFSLPYPREFLALPPADALLARIASATGGRAQISPAQAFDPGREPVQHLLELRAWALWAAAALLLLDVAIRRLRLFGFRPLPL